MPKKKAKQKPKKKLSTAPADAGNAPAPFLSSALQSEAVLASGDDAAADAAVGVEINCSYEYEDADINNILQACLMSGKAARAETRRPVYAMGPVDLIFPQQLADILATDARDHAGQPRDLLVPCNVGHYHWIGLVLRCNERGDCTQVIVADSLDSGVGTFAAIQEVVRQRYATAECSLRTDLIRQRDGTSCGACAIENMLIVIGAAEPPHGAVSMERIRRRQITALSVWTREPGVIPHELTRRQRFLDDFVDRQRHNRPSYDQQAAMEWWKLQQHQGAGDRPGLSAGELGGLIELADMINALPKGCRSQVIAALMMASQSAEHGEVLEKLRQALWGGHDRRISTDVIPENIWGQARWCNYQRQEI